ncbi:hypothetical protein ABTJ37_21685, partial [Acinetobacter baumannii]
LTPSATTSTVGNWVDAALLSVLAVCARTEEAGNTEKASRTARAPGESEGMNQIIMRIITIHDIAFLCLATNIY